MTSFFDDSHSQSTNSTSSNFNSFSSSSRIWSSSAFPSKSTNDAFDNDASMNFGNVNGNNGDRDLMASASSSQSFASGFFFNGDRILHDGSFTSTLGGITMPKTDVTITDSGSLSNNNNNNTGSYPNVISHSLLSANLNHLSSSSNFTNPKSSTDPISVSNNALGSASSLSVPNSYHGHLGYMQSSPQVVAAVGSDAHHETAYSQHNRHQRYKAHSQESHMSQQLLQAPHGNIMTSDHLSNAMEGLQIHGSASGSHAHVSPHQHHPQQHPHHGSNYLAPVSSVLHAPPMHPMMDPLENLLGPFPCVRLRNMPYDANIEDVLLFFQGLMILDVVILPPPVYSGQHQVRTSESFVLFANPSDFQMAFQRNRQLMRHEGASVDIFQGKRQDYYAAVSSQLMHIQQHHSLHHLHNQGEARQRSSSPYGQTNVAASTMNSAMSMTSQMHHPHHLSMHHGQLSLQSGSGATSARTRVARSDSRSKSSGRGSSRGGGLQVGEHTGFLRLRGLPFSTDKNEIYEFFEGYEPIQDSICLTYRSDGRATGEGYVAFQTPDHAEKAMSLHKRMLGSRYIELFISNKEEHGRAKAREPKTDSSLHE
eukprot:CAMPEP_0176501206 /NCGR_PEP_ID=MMETSP0200_2-20121128/14029_1 /TAXON_ID=947934 /ORGANISM="Chaetoceros sp., Strain GSL56" /LENGTH=593 /DNA_ID=CAMNT_0017900061 /DNA_START=2390 /DNA_END=4171 /DNA_ORIENTATION=-